MMTVPWWWRQGLLGMRPNLQAWILPAKNGYLPAKAAELELEAI